MEIDYIIYKLSSSNNMVLDLFQLIICLRKYIQDVISDQW